MVAYDSLGVRAGNQGNGQARNLLQSLDPKLISSNLDLIPCRLVFHAFQQLVSLECKIEKANNRERSVAT